MRRDGDGDEWIAEEKRKREGGGGVVIFTSPRVRISVVYPS